jgi:DNA-binding Lrp family transcriptional regulator
MEVLKNNEIQKFYLTLSVGNPIIIVTIRDPWRYCHKISIGQGETVEELKRLYKLKVKIRNDLIVALFFNSKLLRGN